MGIVARRAVVEDAEELTRLREVMLSIFGPVVDRSWWQPCVEAFETALADSDGPLQAFVTDAPDEPGVLASCSVGVIERRLPGPANPDGVTGYILSVATDPRFRRQGHARASVSATLDWMRDCGVPRVDLHASESGEPMYRDLGFNDPRGRAMTAWLTERR